MSEAVIPRRGITLYSNAEYDRARSLMDPMPDPMLEANPLNNAGAAFTAGVAAASPIAAGARYAGEQFAISGLEPVPGYNPLEDPQIAQYRQFREHFATSRSPDETRKRLQSLERALRREEDMSLFPMASTVGAFVGAAAAPSGMLPLVISRGGIASLRATAATLAPVYAAEEIAMHAGGPTYAMEDSVMNAAMLAGLTGLGYSYVRAINGRSQGRRLGAMANDNRGDAGIPRPEDIGVYDGQVTPADAMQAVRNLSAAAAPGTRQWSYQEELAREGLVSAWGLEKLPINPVTRLAKSAELESRHIVQDLVSSGGLLRNKNIGDDIEAGPIPVEHEFNIRWMPQLIEGLQVMEQVYARYRGLNATESVTRNTIGTRVRNIADKWVDPNAQFLTPTQFREEIAKAMRRGDDHQIPEVREAARAWRTVVDQLKDDGMEVDFFTYQQRTAIRRLMREVDALRAAGLTNTDPAMQGVLNRIDELQDIVNNIRQNGPQQSTAQSYVPRMLRLDKIEAEMDRFVAEVVLPWMRRKGMLSGNTQNDVAQATGFAEKLIQDRPFVPMGPDEIGQASGARLREWDIEDIELEEWLENDIEQVMRFHVRTMGMDIELARRFGDIDMVEQLEEIANNWDMRIAQLQTVGGDAAGAIKQKARDLEDIRALRDRLRGTFGQPDDPYRPLSRFYRITKQLSTLAFMGGALLSQVPDLARPIMTEGLERTFKQGLKPFFSAAGRAARRMATKELRLAGQAVDLTLSMRAAQFTDMSDVMGRRYGFERQMTQATDVMFLVNGMNWWNQSLKEITGTITATRMLDSTLAVLDGSIKRFERTKLARSGIDEDMARRIGEQFRQYGTREEDLNLPNTADWDDVDAVRAFRGALSQEVDRVIVTPGAGDRALWTSTEWGSTLTQFQSFGQAALTRVLISGLQEREGAFFLGSVLLVGLGFLVNEIKKVQHGDERETPFQADLVDAIDRSGILGWYMSVNNAAERLSDYAVGARPLLGVEGYDTSWKTKVGTAFGPGGSIYANALNSLGMTVTGAGDYYDVKAARSILPFNSVFWADWAFDALEVGMTPAMTWND